MSEKLGIKLQYTSLYSPHSNGLVERQHQTLKTSLKAAYVEMGETYKNNWYEYLPWILLMKRTSFQKELGASPAMLTYGTNLAIPGDLLRDPGDPYSESDLDNLREFTRKTDLKPPKQTTPIKQLEVPEPPLDVSHVYTRQHNTTGLEAPYKGPFPIVARPSRTQVKIRVGYSKNNKPRYELRNWRDLKIAHLRPDAEEASRPKRGRPSGSKAIRNQTDNSHDTSVQSAADNTTDINKTDDNQLVQKTQPVAAPLPESSNVGGKPVRSTRNPNPIYVDAISAVGPPAGNPFPSHRVWTASAEDLKWLNFQISPNNRNV